MIIYIGVVTIIMLLIVIGFGISKIQKMEKLNGALTSQVVQTQKAPIMMIGAITKYEDKELDILLLQPEVIELLMKIFAYKIAKKTDSIRSLTETDRKVGYLDCLHETYGFFYQMKQKLLKKEEKEPQDLV